MDKNFLIQVFAPKSAPRKQVQRIVTKCGLWLQSTVELKSWVGSK